MVSQPVDKELLNVVASSGTDPGYLLFNVAKYVTNKKSSNSKKANSSSESSSGTYKDTKVSGANAYTALAYRQLKRFINKFERMYLH